MTHEGLLELSFASGESSLSVRRFVARERICRLFEIEVWARSVRGDLDLSALAGDAATFAIGGGFALASHSGARRWSGVCHVAELVQGEATGLSTYYFRIAPTLWLLTQRTDYRVFQRATIPEIVDSILAEWSITASWTIERSRYPKLDYRVQYDESDYAFVSRLLEEAGITCAFPDSAGGGAVHFADAPGSVEPIRGAPFAFSDNVIQAEGRPFLSKVQLRHTLRPGAVALRDHDFRNPSFDLKAGATSANALEARLERFHYRPGSFLQVTGATSEVAAQNVSTPTADDKGAVRHEGEYGARLAGSALASLRADRRSVEYATNVIELSPGAVFALDGHPHPDLQSTTRLLAVDLTISGGVDTEWQVVGRALFASEPYRPPLVTPKPSATGVQSATVVGPAGEEIYTDEFGRVRVQFPWDRRGRGDADSSCWMRVSQGWAGSGYGMVMLPRVGQEVLVGFLEGDPDQPVILGRVFNNTQRVPYKLPEHKTRSTWKSASSPGGNGFNEILFEDLAGQELMFVQAERDLRRLVKNDEVLTIGNDRQKLVKRNETEVTGANRVELTGASRTEVTAGNRVTTIGGSEQKLVEGDESERTEGHMRLRIGGDQHVIVKGARRERVVGDQHAIVQGDRLERVSKTASLIAGSYQQRVAGSHVLEIADEIHLKSGSAIVIEAPEITLKAAGGFIHIHGGGVDIQGTLVRINSGGAAGSASGGEAAAAAEAPTQLTIEAPAVPVVEDVSLNRLGRA